MAARSPTDHSVVDPWLALAARPGFLIRRLHQIHVALFAEECAAFGVTPVQFSLLSVLAMQPGLDQAALAFAVGVDRATTANVVARLEKRGLLRRRSGATDRRVKQVELTAVATVCWRASTRTHAARMNERWRRCGRPSAHGSWPCCAPWSMLATRTGELQCCCSGRSGDGPS